MARECTYLIYIRNLIVIPRPRKIRITDDIDFRTVSIPIDLLHRSRRTCMGVGGSNPIEGEVDAAITAVPVTEWGCMVHK